ncbi:PRTRC system protein E [Ralstonia chuxiongensis]|uniref:PRTRC system protein E n=1 Tax=Ralstonia chuxiongensis TaxID=2957504 RepID=A0AA41WUE5_9RALS|nr:PRTRC system protein E [Ralstonia chuxiongensis]MCP1173003.1 PRTRC system protein E [Ralstonia chuxiongensis]
MFAELHQLARAASLLISVAAEGDNLRVTVNATSTSKNGPGVHPLVLVGTPQEIDEGFAEAVQIFEPSALPLLDQARAAANANGKKGTPALEAPKAATKKTQTADTPPKRGPGRPTNAEKAAAEAAKNGGTGGTEAPATGTKDGTDPEMPAVDPRQMSLVDSDGADSSGTGDAPAAEPASTDPRHTGLDLPI